MCLREVSDRPEPPLGRGAKKSATWPMFRVSTHGSLDESRRGLIAFAPAKGAPVDRHRVEQSFTTARSRGFLLPPGEPDRVTSMHRREDLLSLRFEFFNLRLLMGIEAAHPVLVRIRSDREAVIVVVFPTQAVTEQAFPEHASAGELGHGADDGPAGEPSPPRIPHAAAGESRLAFTVPRHVTGIPYTLASLLDWTQLEPRLVPVASGQPDPPTPTSGPTIGVEPFPVIRQPTERETGIELPYGMLVSPSPASGWAHALRPVTRNGRTEVWHTRLGVRSPGGVDEWDATDRTLRGVWALTPSSDDPEPAALSPDDRQAIVEASSTYTSGSTPTPVDVNRLMLSTLGGHLDVAGRWDAGSLGGDLEEWRHVATMGRDHYVRIVSRGFLFPYGHRASIVTVTERRFDTLQRAASSPLAGGWGAYLRQRRFLIVREPVKHYGASGDPEAAFGQPHAGRAWPFRSIRVRTLATPVLDSVATEDAFAGIHETFVPTVGGATFRFNLAGTDLEGRTSEASVPVVFVPGEVALAAGGSGMLREAFNDLDEQHPLRVWALAGQKVALAAPEAQGDTTMDVADLVVGVDAPSGGPTTGEVAAQGQPLFYPRIDSFGARLSAAEETSGTQLGVTRFVLEPYIEQGFPGQVPGQDAQEVNIGEVFARVVGTGSSVGFAADRAGGLVTPDVSIACLSRKLGSVGGEPEQIRAGTFDPAQVFASDAAKLLGGIRLADIIRPVSLLDQGDRAMRITTRPEFGDGDGQPPTAMLTELEWKPELQADQPLRLFDPWSTPGDPRDASLEITARFRQDLIQPDRSTYSIEGELTDFRLNLVGAGDFTTFMIVTFERLSFTSATGEKTDVDVAIDNIAFDGPLRFVDRIRDFLTFGGSGPFIDPQPSGVTVGYELELPQIPLGALMLNNITVSAALHIPFSGDPAHMRFALSSRENPFDVTYSAIGGGGYFAIAFGLDGLVSFECALELGAYLSLDLGVASGSISVAAGFHFGILYADNGERPTVELTAYMRFVGKVEVLRFIAVSLEVYLGLTYHPPSKLVGKATAELTVKVLFFTGSVKVEIERRIGSTPNDPTVADLFDAADWERYALAFA